MVDRVQALAYRIAAQELHRPHGTLGELAALDLGIQDAGQVSARLAITARLDVEPARLAGGSFVDALDEAGVTLAWTHRGAPHLHRRDELAEVAAAMVPLSDADGQARLSWQRGDVAQADMPVTQALTTAAHALRQVVDATMTKGAASERVSKILPAGLTRWCRGCQATHIHEQLMRLSTLRAGIRLEPEVSPATLTPLEGTKTVVESPDVPACVRVVERYLHLHGPAGQSEAAGFVCTNKTTAKEMWPDELVEVSLDGKPAFLAAQDIAALENPPEPDFVRLLPPLDPLLQARDRLTLVPDKDHHKAVWKIIGNPGAILAGGEIVGTWRAKARGRKSLDFTLAPFWKLSKGRRSEIEAEAARIATVRGFPAMTVAS